VLQSAPIPWFHRFMDRGGLSKLVMQVSNITLHDSSFPQPLPIPTILAKGMVINLNSLISGFPRAMHAIIGKPDSYDDRFPKGITTEDLLRDWCRLIRPEYPDLSSEIFNLLTSFIHGDGMSSRVFKALLDLQRHRKVQNIFGVIASMINQDIRSANFNSKVILFLVSMMASDTQRYIRLSICSRLISADIETIIQKLRSDNKILAPALHSFRHEIQTASTTLKLLLGTPNIEPFSIEDGIGEIFDNSEDTEGLFNSLNRFTQELSFYTGTSTAQSVLTPEFIRSILLFVRFLLMSSPDMPVTEAFRRSLELCYALGGPLIV